MTQHQCQVTLINDAGLHARPAGKIAKLAQTYDAQVVVSCKDKTAQAKSVLELMLLGAYGGDQLTVTADGPEAEKALSAIQSLIGNAFQGSIV